MTFGTFDLFHQGHISYLKQARKYIEDESGKKVIPIPLHKEIAKGTLLSIMHQAGLTREEFIQMLK